MFVNRGGLKCEDAIRDALAGGGWMNRDALAKATGFSRSRLARVLKAMSDRCELHERTYNVDSGGLAKEYRVALPGEEVVKQVLWEARDLDVALGGMTFPPPNMKHPKPRFRHRVLY